MRRLAFFVTAAFLAAGTGLWVSQSYFIRWEPQMRTQIEQRAGAAFGVRVHIEAILISFIHRFALKNVEIWDARQTPEVLIFRAKEVSLTASLIDLPRALYHRNPFEIIGLITVDTPLVTLSAEQLHRRPGGSSKMNTTPPWFALEWNDGTFEWKDPEAPNGAWTLRQSRGFFRIRGPHIDALARGTIDPAHSVDIRVRTLGNRWTAEARLFEGDISGIVELARHFTRLPQIPEGWKASGRFDIDLSARGRWPIPPSEKPISLLRDARVSFSNAQIEIPNAPAITWNGDLHFNGSQIEAAGLTVKSENNLFTLSGNAQPFSKPPQIDLEAVCAQMELAALSDFLLSTSSGSSLLNGVGSLAVSVHGSALQPNVLIQGKFPKGAAGPWPFENAVVQVRRHENRWEIDPSTVHIWDGNLTLKGTHSDEETHIQLTGKDMLLQAAHRSQKPSGLKGRLNFSLTTQGDADSVQTTGSFWINELTWAKEQPESVRGDLDMTPSHFELHGASDDERIHLQFEGTRTSKTITLQQGLLQWRPMSFFNSHGSYNLSNHRSHILFEAKAISLAEDIPLPVGPLDVLQGHANIQGSLDGAFPEIVFKADIQSSNLRIGSSPPAAASASLHGTANEITVDTFHIDPGLSGSLHASFKTPPQWDLKLSLSNMPAATWAAFTGKEKNIPGTLSGTLALSHAPGWEGHGDLTLSESAWGNLTLSQGALRFSLHDRSLDLEHFSLTTSQGNLDLKGHAAWERPLEGKPIDRVMYHAEGHAVSPHNGTLWSAAYRVRGQIHPSDSWKGTVHVEAPSILIRQKESEPLEADLHWDKTGISWDSLKWGHTLTSNGSLQFNDGQPIVSGEIHAQDLDLARWHTLIAPQTKEPLRGALTGSFSMNGPIEDPLVKFSGSVKNGIWRAFRFQTTVAATWKKTGLEPVVLDGSLLTGGQFHFQGRVSLADQTASGSLDLSQVELQPIAESLSFPHVLENKASGTLTVSGPLNQLRFAGHVEGGPLIYGSETTSPLRLQSYVMDLKLAPAQDAYNVTRLTVTQALAKTQEEEIRLSPGSYIDFAGLSEAHLQIGTEIRNLHLGVFTLFGGLDINGTWQIRPQGFAVQGDLFTRSLYINDYQLEQGHVQASYYNRVLSFQPPRNSPALVTGTVDFQNAPELNFKDFAITGRGHESLHLTGTVGPQNWNFSMEGAGLDISTLGGLAGFPYSLNGSANVKLKGTGDLEHPNVEGTLDVQDGRILGLSFQTGSAAFAWQGQRMTFTRLQLSDPGRYTLNGVGVFPVITTKTTKVPVDNTIDFTLRLTDSNLGLLQSITSEVKSAKGSVQALVQIKGTSDVPTWQGSIQVKNGDVDGAHYFKRVRDVQVAADFDGNDLVISDFRGKSGKGEFVGGGHILFSGFKPKFYDLHVDVPSSKPIEVTVPELAIPETPLAKKFHFLTLASQGDAKAHVTFRGPAEAPVFFGEANISNGHFTFPPSSKNPPPPGFMEWMRRITWDVNLHFADGAWFENELVEANLIGNLAIKGPSDKLRVDGGMDISEGKISYLGIEFDIQQGRFDIRSSDSDNGIVTTPYVRGVGESKVQTVDPISGQGVDDTVTLTINYAPVTEIKPQLRSSNDPTLTQDKVLSRVTQLEVENMTPQERNALYQQQMVRVLDTSLATPLARSLLKRTGLVDELRVSRVLNPTTPLTDPNNPNTTQQDTAVNLLAGTKYTLAKNLSNRLSLGYGLRFEQTINPDLTDRLDLRSDVEMSYRVLSNVYLRGSFDLPSQTTGVVPDRKVTIEPHWRFGWWGNTNKPKPKLPNPQTPLSLPTNGTNSVPTASQ